MENKHKFDEYYQDLKKILRQIKYTNIGKVYNENWANEYKNKGKSSKGFPEPLIALNYMNLGLLPNDYFDRLERGLEFLFSHSKGQNKKDLKGNLQGGSKAAIFEVMLAWSLIEEFGSTQVEPYPRINNTSKKTLDFAISDDLGKILIEATTLFDDKNTSEMKMYSFRRNYPMFEQRNNAEDMHRLFTKCLDKVKQREITEPLLLCINQYAACPDPASGAEAIGRLVANAIWDKNSKLIGIAYFYNDSLVAFCIVENKRQALAIDSALVGKTYSAMCRISKK